MEVAASGEDALPLLLQPLSAIDSAPPTSINTPRARAVTITPVYG
jgi:hypothetical protein